MKKIMFSSALVLSAMTIMAGPVLAATVATTSNEGDITFERKGDDDDTENPIIDPVDPGKEDPVIDDEDDNNNGTKGPLKIDHITNFHFDKQKISGNNETYYARAAKVVEVNGTKKDSPNFVQVTDDRGSNAGWEITVQQEHAFQDAANSANKILGTTLHLRNLNVMMPTAGNANQAPAPKVNAAGAISIAAGTGEQTFASAAAETGMGSWNMRIGDVATAAKSVALDVPGAQKKVNGAKYTTKLTWTIKDEPSKGL